MGSAASAKVNGKINNTKIMKIHESIDSNNQNISYNEFNVINTHENMNRLHKFDTVELKSEEMSDQSIKTIYSSDSYNNKSDSYNNNFNFDIEDLDNISNSNNLAQDISSKLFNSISQVLLMNRNNNHNNGINSIKDFKINNSSLITFMDEDSNKSIRTIEVDCFDYYNCGQDKIKRFHSLSSCPSSPSNLSNSIDSNSCTMNGDNSFLNNNNNPDFCGIPADADLTIVHNCNLCNMSFETENNFINHTKFSKIHHIALLQYNSRN